MFTVYCGIQKNQSCGATHPQSKNQSSSHSLPPLSWSVAGGQKHCRQARHQSTGMSSSAAIQVSSLPLCLPLSYWALLSLCCCSFAIISWAHSSSLLIFKFVLVPFSSSPLVIDPISDTTVTSWQRRRCRKHSTESVYINASFTSSSCSQIYV